MENRLGRVIKALAEFFGLVPKWARDYLSPEWFATLFKRRVKAELENIEDTVDEALHPPGKVHNARLPTNEHRTEKDKGKITFTDTH